MGREFGAESACRAPLTPSEGARIHRSMSFAPRDSCGRRAELSSRVELRRSRSFDDLIASEDEEWRSCLLPARRLCDGKRRPPSPVALLKRLELAIQVSALLDKCVYAV